MSGEQQSSNKVGTISSAAFNYFVSLYVSVGFLLLLRLFLAALSAPLV